MIICPTCQDYVFREPAFARLMRAIAWSKVNDTERYDRLVKAMETVHEETFKRDYDGE